MSLLLLFGTSGAGGGCSPTEPPTGNALKLETGDHLLLETCDHLLLESGDVDKVFAGWLRSPETFRVPQMLLHRMPGWLGRVYHTEEPGVRIPQQWLQTLYPNRPRDLSFAQHRPMGWQGHVGLGPFWDGTGNPPLCDPNWTNTGIAVNCTTAWTSNNTTLCSTEWSSSTASPTSWLLDIRSVESDWTADDPTECVKDISL